MKQDERSLTSPPSKGWRPLFIFLTLLFIISCQKKSETPFLKEGSIVPNIILRSADGTSNWSLENEKAPVVIINFWATWCFSCKEQMPSMKRFFQERKGKGVKLITILFRDDPFRAMEFMQERGYDFPVTVDPDLKIAQLFGVTGVPETYIINRERILLNRIIGPFDWDSPDFKQYIDGLLK